MSSNPLTIFEVPLSLLVEIILKLKLIQEVIRSCLFDIFSVFEAISSV
jgi:uncharacterized protein (DUF486 family)